MSRTRALAGLGLLALTAAATPARAQQATIVVNINEDVAEALGLDPDQLESELSGAMTQDLKLEGQEEFLTQMARAALMAGKGMGVDYASNPQRFILGGSVGTAVDGAGARFGRGDDGLPLGGFAFQGSIMAGLNLGAFSEENSALRRFVIYANGLVADTRLEPFDADFVNLGAHLQIKIIGAAGEGDAVEWGGLDLTGGYEYAGYKLRLEQPLPIDTGVVTWDADGGLSIGTNSTSVPIELSTNLRILVATVFVGAAYDYNMPSFAQTELSLIGPIVANEGQTNGQNVGNASVTLTTTGATVPSGGRIFAGAQLEVFMIKAYGQVNVGLDDTFGGHVGVRIVL